MEDTEVHRRARPNRMTDWLFERIDPSLIGIYRIVFGIVLGFELKRLWGELIPAFVTPACHLSLDAFGWVQPLSAGWMQLELLVMGIAAVCFTIGLFPRIAAVPLFFGYGHFLFAEQLRYNNHYYLIWLMIGFFAFVDSSAAYSMDAWRRGHRRDLPFWNLGFLRLQIIIVYFYGGLAKICSDWLRGEPLTMHVREFLGADSQWLEWAPGIGLFLSYGGLVFDLVVGFALLHRVTRLIVIPFSSGFHVSNSFLFSIGVFPWLSIASMMLFFPPDQIKRWADGVSNWISKKVVGKVKQEARLVSRPSQMRWMVISALSIYFLVQLTLPFRNRLLPGNFHWTREHFQFSWTMKLARRDNFMAVEIVDAKRGFAYLASPDEDLIEIPENPNGIWDYCKFLSQDAVSKGIEDPKVFVLYASGLNGRPFQLFVRPDTPINLQPRPNLGHADWVLPLQEDLPIGMSKSDEERRQQGMTALRQIVMQRKSQRTREGINTRGYFEKLDFGR